MLRCVCIQLLYSWPEREVSKKLRYHTLPNVPYLVSEFSQLPWIIPVELEFRLWIDQDTRIELATTEHDRGMNMRVLIQYSLYYISTKPPSAAGQINDTVL